MTIHLVYPYKHPKTGKHTAAPWSIGHNVAVQLRKRGYTVLQYDWDDRGGIAPKEKGNYLIGHPHPEPGRIFRNSLCSPWSKVISMAPWNGSDEYRDQQEYVWTKVDSHIAICGEYWWDAFGPRAYANRPRRVDMAINPADFAPLNHGFGVSGERKYLYIGCTVPVKGTKWLEHLIERHNLNVGHIGYGRVKGATAHGYVDVTSEHGRSIVNGYDFLISPGRNDANPTTVLEAMCWGLPVVRTRQSGWGGTVDGWVMEHGDDESAACALEGSQDCAGSKLQEIVARNQNTVFAYSWKRFADEVIKAIEA